MTLLLGLDIGTTGARCLAINEDGRIVASASQGYPLFSPKPGWSEQNPDDWWDSTRKVVAQVVAEAQGNVVGIGLTGQMHGSVFLDRNGVVIRPALLWNDQRTLAQCEAINDKVGADRLLEIAGNPSVTGFQAPKILWLRDEEPAAY